MKTAESFRVDRRMTARHQVRGKPQIPRLPCPSFVSLHLVRPAARPSEVHYDIMRQCLAPLCRSALALYRCGILSSWEVVSPRRGFVMASTGESIEGLRRAERMRGQVWAAYFRSWTWYAAAVLLAGFGLVEDWAPGWAGVYFLVAGSLGLAFGLLAATRRGRVLLGPSGAPFGRARYGSPWNQAFPGAVGGSEGVRGRFRNRRLRGGVLGARQRAAVGSAGAFHPHIRGVGSGLLGGLPRRAALGAAEGNRS